MQVSIEGHITVQTVNGSTQNIKLLEPLRMSSFPNYGVLTCSIPIQSGSRNPGKENKTLVTLVVILVNLSLNVSLTLLIFTLLGWAFTETQVLEGFYYVMCIINSVILNVRVSTVCFYIFFFKLYYIFCLLSFPYKKKTIFISGYLED